VTSDLKILHLNAFDRGNGASIAADRLHRGLREAGVDSRMWVQNKLGSDPSVYGPRRGIGKYWNLLRPWLDRLPLAAIGKLHDFLYSASWLPRRDWGPLREWTPDVLHLHWVQNGFLPVRAIRRLPGPLVWTLHDQWPSSGLRHHPFPGREPPTGLEARWDRWLRRRKEHSYPWSRIQGIAPSGWLREQVANSSTWKAGSPQVLANPIDTRRFHPVEPILARRLLGLPTDQPLILFGAAVGTTDPLKGFDRLQAACRRLVDQGLQFGLVAFGEKMSGLEESFPIHPLGFLHDDPTLALVYSAADVLALPSRLDNLPNTGVEAQACGCPVVGFRVGGVPELVEEGVSGTIEGDVDAFADALAGYLTDPTYRQQASAAARHRAETHFSTTTLIPRFLELYESVRKKG
jgi:glycosyltransferase involved in cell wall biosynthesis